MMCGGCVSRVKSVLSADERVDSVAVNMLTETAAIKLRPEVAADGVETVAESLAGRLTECGFASKRRASGMGVTESVRKWKEMAGLASGALLGPGRGWLVFCNLLVLSKFFDYNLPSSSALA
ncbi:copper-transporting ATPase PAA2 chloroplastic [Prunus yedoensis var. nudiflora]|uniref:Copper-transporting ATPase PAA2 chloroplastic n=1 Tax=Prunus yedoensis var. nudiflora TaxID=2094558 RepID=A0A314Y4F8_PRUYE|nr:copper-transporting ATPase PAA2 chloroplastic [Prunus yedoensis var. nudiflora]